MNNEFQQWLDRKLSRPFSYLKESKTVKYSYHKIFGPTTRTAEVVLTGKPAEKFSFTSQVNWPETPDACNECVLEGILDILISSDFNPTLGVSFILEDIRWHEIESAPFAFYHAAREATKQILWIDEKQRNADSDLQIG
jgi:hypothetical protein